VGTFSWYVATLTGRDGQVDKLKILLTNDDGIESLGLRSLWESLDGKVALLRVVAPSREASCAGLGVTMTQPLSVEPVHIYPGTPSWKIGGTPADCVKLALSVLLDFSPDFIVSGINHGANAGRNVLYSGTVGGVIEGTLRGIPGVAFSYSSSMRTLALSHVKPFIPQIINYMQDHPLPSGSFLNVNFPHINWKEIKGLKMAKQGRSYWMETPKYRGEMGDSPSEYWMGGTHVSFQEHEHSDIALLAQGYITAVPIYVDELTDLHYFAEKRGVFEQRFSANPVTID